MTTRVLSVVITPNVHCARVTTQDKHNDGWVEAEHRDVEIGQTCVHDGYITDTRRILIEEIPLKKEGV